MKWNKPIRLSVEDDKQGVAMGCFLGFIVLVIVALFACVMPFLVQVCWNAFLPSVSNGSVGEISFLQSFALCFLVSALGSCLGVFRK